MTAAKAVENPRSLLKGLFDAAVNAADPAHCLTRFLPAPPKGRTIVVGAGKAAASMAKAVEDNWPGALEGIVVTRYGHGLDCERIEVVEAAHPVPDDKGQAAARRIMETVRALSADDLVLCLISGGGSSLLAMPGVLDGPEARIEISLADKQAVNKALLRSGANIVEMNTVRKHLSGIKGGRLATAAYPARIVTLGISDIPGDDPAVIASGPTLPDPTTVEDALAILAKYSIDIPENVAAFLRSPAASTPKPGDPAFANSEFRMIATPQSCLEAAGWLANESGLDFEILGDAIEGEARDVANDQAARALSEAGRLQAGDPAKVLISGGETTVTVKGNGRGGRNAEFLLALAIALQGRAGIHAVACDTDGIDGSEDNAGAYIGPDTLARAAAIGLDPQAYLANNDGYSFFERLGDLIKTGPTLTNVNDFRAIFIAGEQR